MAYRVKIGEDSFALLPGESLVGRGASCHIQLNHRSVSRRHARILVIGERAVIEDLGSSNGTLVNGQRTAGAVELPGGAEVRIGKRTFTIVDESPDDEKEDTTPLPEAVPSYQVPSTRTCAGCRHLIVASAARCPLCGTPQHRTNESALTLKAWIDPEGRRSARRFAVKLKGLYVSATLTTECEIVDISLQGAMVRADLLDEPDTECDLVIFVAENDVVRVPGRVVRLDGDRPISGMGIHFRELGDAARTWIETTLSLIEMRV